MPKSRILAVRAADGRTMPVAPDSSVSLSSAGAGWDGVFVERQSLPPTRVPEVFMARHLLSIQVRPPSVLRCRGNEGPRDRRLAQGDVFFQATFASGRYAWPEETEVLNLAVDPGLVSRVALEEFGDEWSELVGEAGGRPPTQAASPSEALRQ